MRRSVALLLGSTLWLAAAFSPGLASAAPPASYVVPFECSDGQTYDINFGAPPNAGSAGFVLDTNQALVGKSFAGYFEGEEAFSWVRGVQGFDPSSLLVCTASLGPWSYIITGWMTPRG